MKKLLINLIQSFFKRFGILVAKYNLKGDINERLADILTKKNIDIFFDIGANKGQFAREMFNHGYKNKIISFEPTKKACFMLKNFAEDNSSWIVEDRCAIGDFEREISINISENSVSSSILPLIKGKENIGRGLKSICQEKVRMFKLDQFIEKYSKKDKKMFLKLDVQGYEMKILKACKNLLKFEGIFAELQINPYYEGGAFFDEIIQFLKKQNFILVDIEPGFRDQGGAVLEFDAIFLKRENILDL